MPFSPHLVDEHASVGAQASESETDMVVDLADLPHRPRILQLGRRLALDPEADDVLAPHANLSEEATVSGGAIASLNTQPACGSDGGNAAHRGGPLPHRLEGVFHLEQMSVRREDCDGAVIAR